MNSFAPWPLVSLSFATASLAVLLIAAPGVALAWLLARRDFPGKTLVETLVTLPLVLPPVATGLVLLELFGNRGPIGHWLEKYLGLSVVFTWRGVVLAMAVMSFPLLVRTARAAFEGVPDRLENIARSLGASHARVFRTVTLPLARQGLIAGALLSFARAIGEFGATVMVAGSLPGRTLTLSLGIYQLVLLGRDGEALRLAGLAALTIYGIVAASEWLLRRTRRAL